VGRGSLCRSRAPYPPTPDARTCTCVCGHWGACPSGRCSPTARGCGTTAARGGEILWLSASALAPATVEAWILAPWVLGTPSPSPLAPLVGRQNLQDALSCRVDREGLSPQQMLHRFDALRSSRPRQLPTHTNRTPTAPIPASPGEIRETTVLYTPWGCVLQVYIALFAWHASASGSRRSQICTLSLSLRGLPAS
jgi:hypothetical protein